MAWSFFTQVSDRDWLLQWVFFEASAIKSSTKRSDLPFQARLNVRRDR